MDIRLITALGALSTFSIVAGPVHSAGEAAAEPVNCVSLARVDYTHAVDDQTILFYMRGSDVYVNRLSNPASGLSRNRPFLYKSSTGLLCNHDIITVLEPVGFGYMQGAWSSLGKFVPTDAAHADALRSGEPVDAGIEPISGE